MSQTVALNCRIKREVAEGRWIYSMLLPNAGEQIDGDRFLSAERMERIRLKNTAAYLWKMSWVFTMKEMEAMQNECNIAFF